MQTRFKDGNIMVTGYLGKMLNPAQLERKTPR